MKGSYNVFVQNNKLRYEFTIKRNITIIRGNSATGKTTLLDLLSEYETEGKSSGTVVKCEKECRVLSGRHWQDELSIIHDSLVFIDECNTFVRSMEFAKAIKKSDCYFIIVTREDLPNLPYSADEIYGIRTSNKYAGLKQCYNEFFKIYGDYSVADNTDKVVIVEDSNET